MSKQPGKCSITGKKLFKKDEVIPRQVYHIIDIDTGWNSVFDEVYPTTLYLSEEVMIRTIMFWKGMKGYKPNKKMKELISRLNNNICIKNNEIVVKNGKDILYTL